jgi:hypothetical protein
LLRSTAVGDRPDTAQRAEVALILTRGIQEGQLEPQDRTYLDQLVSSRTGMSAPEAETRVTRVFDEARESTDAARKAAAHSLYWTFVALLIGAFCASFGATIGGRERDLQHV